MYRMRTLAVLALAAILFGSCAAPIPLPSGAIRVPTDENLVSSATSHILCTLSATIPSVSGVFGGDASDTEWPVWVQNDEGRRMYVLWPRGFSVRFDPEATLLDENGDIVLHAGSPVVFGQVGADPAKGTKDRPYVAGGLWETGFGKRHHCYHEQD